MGRQHTRKVSVNGTVSSYLQIAVIDAVSGVFRWFLFQNLTQPEATRLLAIRKDGAWYAYGWDLTRNVTEIFGKAGYLRTVYTYTPYGEVTAEGDVALPIQWSREYNDDELGLVYYNYRNLNPHDGRRISRDPIMKQGGWNLYLSLKNNSYLVVDYLGTIPPPGGVWTGTTGYESLRIPSSVPSNSRKKNLTKVLWKGIKRKVIVVAKTIEKYNITTRLQGALQVMGGGFEATAGSAGLLAPEPTAMSKVIGAILYVHGNDVAQAGLRVLITGEYNSTMTHEAITSAAKAVGVSPQFSENIATGAEIALGAKALSTPVKSCCPTVIVEAENVEVTTVSRWGAELKPNTWVMEGEPTLWNYIWSGKWQPGMGNKFSPPWKVQSYVVPKKSIECPGGKGIDGAIKLLVPAKQRIYKP